MQTRRRTLVILIVLVLTLLHPGVSPNPAAAEEEPGGHPVFLPLVSREHDASWHWGETAFVDLTPTPRNSVMAIDRDGRVHVLWDTYSSSGAAFIYHTYQTESGWTDPAKVANTLGISEILLRPLIDARGRLHLVWHNSLAFGGPYRLMYASFDGEGWSPEEEAARDTQRLPSAMVNYAENGDILLGYMISGIVSATPYIRTRTPAGWGEPVNITPPSGYPYVSWSYWFDRVGGVRLYGYTSEGSSYFSYWQAGHFLIQRQVFSSVLSYNSKKYLDRADNLHIYRTGQAPVPGGSITGIYHQCVDADLQAGPETVLSGTNPLGGYSPQIASDSQEKLAFAWKLNNTHLFNLVLLDGCTTVAEKEGQFTGYTNPYSWGDLAAIAVSSQPAKFCALVDIAYVSNKFGLLCADTGRG